MNTSSSTDNLYKFCALSGVVICLFSLYVPYRFYDELAQRGATLAVDTRRSEIEANHLFQETEQLNKTIQEQTQPPAEGYSPSKMFDEEIKLKTSTLSAWKLKLNIKYAEIKAANAELGRISRLSTGIKILGIVGFVVGLGLALYGVRCWHDRIQLPQNLAIQNEMDKLAQEKTARR